MISYEGLKEILLKNKDILYPNIPYIYANSNYIKLLYDLYAGENGSELTVIAQYAYQYMNLESNNIISKILKDISIQEMRHFEILGKIIKSLGGKPMYQSSKGNVWNANKLNYEINSIEKLIQHNIKIEEYSINQYRKIQRYTSNVQLRKIYERIIQDEYAHLKIFNLILEEFKE